MPRPKNAEKVLARCKEIGLSEVQKKLLTDLLGWNFKEGSKELPVAYLGVEPHLTARAAVQDVAMRDVQVWASIEDLLRKILGDARMLAACVKPVRVFQDEMGLPREQVVWLAIQLHLSETAPELLMEMLGLYAKTLGQMANDVVMPTLCRLLELPRD